MESAHRHTQTHTDTDPHPRTHPHTLTHTHTHSCRSTPALLLALTFTMKWLISETAVEYFSAGLCWQPLSYLHTHQRAVEAQLVSTCLKVHKAKPATTTTLPPPSRPKKSPPKNDSWGGGGLDTNPKAQRQMASRVSSAKSGNTSTGLLGSLAYLSNFSISSEVASTITCAAQALQSSSASAVQQLQNTHTHTHAQFDCAARR